MIKEINKETLEELKDYSRENLVLKLQTLDELINKTDDFESVQKFKERRRAVIYKIIELDGEKPEVFLNYINQLDEKKLIDYFKRLGDRLDSVGANQELDKVAEAKMIWYFNEVIWRISEIKVSTKDSTS